MSLSYFGGYMSSKINDTMKTRLCQSYAKEFVKTGKEITKQNVIKFLTSKKSSTSYSNEVISEINNM